MWCDADTTQIKPVGIPASLNGHVGMGTFVRVAVARLEQQPELMVFEIENAAPQIQSEFSRSWAVLRISHFVLPPRVMENSKELHDLNIGSGLFGQSQAVFENSGPVRHAMIAVERQGVIFEDGSKDRSEVNCHLWSTSSSGVVRTQLNLSLRFGKAISHSCFGLKHTNTVNADRTKVINVYVWFLAITIVTKPVEIHFGRIVVWHGIPVGPAVNQMDTNK